MIFGLTSCVASVRAVGENDEARHALMATLISDRAAAEVERNDTSEDCCNEKCLSSWCLKGCCYDGFSTRVEHIGVSKEKACCCCLTVPCVKGCCCQGKEARAVSETPGIIVGNPGGEYNKKEEKACSCISCRTRKADHDRQRSTPLLSAPTQERFY